MRLRLNPWWVGLCVLLPAVLTGVAMALRHVASGPISFPFASEIARALPALVSDQVPVQGNIIFIHHAILTTLKRVAITVGIATAVGILMGFLLTVNRTMWKLSQPALDFTRAIPVTFLVPPAAIVLGFGHRYMPWLLAAIPCILIVVLQVRQGRERLDDERIHAFHVLSGTTSKVQTFFHLTLREVLPEIETGLRLTVSYAIVAVSVLEYVGTGSSVPGLGAYVSEAAHGSRIHPPAMYAAIVIFGVMGLLMNRGLEWLSDRRLRRLHE